MNLVPRPLVHFHRLEDLARELAPGRIVRVVALPQPRSGEHGPQEWVAVHVRAMDEDGTLLACMLPVERIALDDPERGARLPGAVGRAEELADRVREWLMVEFGFHVRDGLLDLEGRQTVPGWWEGDPGPSSE